MVSEYLAQDHVQRQLEKEPETALFDACMEVVRAKQNFKWHVSSSSFQVRAVEARKASDNLSVILVAFDHVPANTAPMPSVSLVEDLKVNYLSTETILDR